jgi:hydrogenase maturation factor
MCLGLVGEVVSVDPERQVVRIEGWDRDVSIMTLPETQVGDTIRIHAGFAVGFVADGEA